MGAGEEDNAETLPGSCDYSVRNWGKAIRTAAVAEQQLADLLWESGEFIQVSLWGQSQLSDKDRKALRLTSALLRWAPDVIGITSEHDVMLFDAKSTTKQNKDSPNVAVEARAVDALGCHDMLVSSALFVFDNHYQATAELVKAEGVKRDGSSNGSGTPFYLVSKDALDPFWVGKTDMWALHQKMTNSEKWSGLS